MHTTTGWIIGHFEPLHRGHVRLIQHAVGLVEKLHIVILEHPNPKKDYEVSLEDKARWMQRAFNQFDFIDIHTYPIANIDPEHPEAQEQLHHLREALGISDKAKLISDETHTWRHHLSARRFIALPRHEDYDTDSIHHDPVHHWLDIHPTARREYTKTVAIVGGESSGKTTLVYKLANYFLADYVLEQGRHYVDYALGGNQLALQFSDYQRISQDHAKAVDAALEDPKAPVTIIDTDFVTTQAFCETYEDHRNPMTAAFIDNLRFDHTLLLSNNTVWIDDGMRVLGDVGSRKTFHELLAKIYREHGIAVHEIGEPSYQERYRLAVQYIHDHIYRHPDKE